MTTLTAPPGPEPLERHRISPLAGLRHGLTLTWRGLVRIKHSPDRLLDVTLQPIIFVVLFVFLFGGAIAGGWQSYLQFILPGLLVQTLVFGSMGTGVNLNDDISKGVFDRFRSLPIARWAPLFGTVTADVVKYVVSLLITLGFGAVLGFNYGNIGGVVAGSLLVLFFSFAICWIFATVGLLVKSPQAVQGLGIVVVMPLTFGSNLFVKASSLPGWLQDFVHVNPISHLISAVRGLLHGSVPTGDIAWSLIGAAAIVAVFAPLAVAIYRRRT